MWMIQKLVLVEHFCNTMICGDLRNMIVTYWYGAIPEGFQNALERLGLDGQEPRVYLLHKFMSESGAHRKSFSHASKIDASTVTTMACLRVPLQNYELAKQLRKPDDIKTLAQDDAAKYAAICANVVEAAKRGHSVSAVLKRQYYLTPFPEPVVPDSESRLETLGVSASCGCARGPVRGNPTGTFPVINL